MKLSSAILIAPVAIAAPLYGATSSNVIPDQWIVVLKQDAVAQPLEPPTSEVLMAGAQQLQTFDMGESSFKGYSMRASKEVAEAVATSPKVAYVQPDYRVSIYDTTRENTTLYGLHSISHRVHANSSKSMEYIYDKEAGENTWAYVIDTGIYTEHNDFEGRAEWGKTFPITEKNIDCQGHGTHVAGTIGGKTYGVAKKTNLIAVKVLDCEGGGATSDVLKGLEWAVKDMKEKKRVGQSVANLSLGTYRRSLAGQRDALMEAAAEAVKQGMFLAVAAGNDRQDVKDFSPASEESVCTVGAVDQQDKYAIFSNYGSGVDISAPGVNITSAFNNGKDGEHVLSGTSMATPHVSGLGAYLLSLGAKYSAKTLCKQMQELAVQGAIPNLPDASKQKNLLAFNGVTGNANSTRPYRRLVIGESYVF